MSWKTKQMEKKSSEVLNSGKLFLIIFFSNTATKDVSNDFPEDFLLQLFGNYFLFSHYDSINDLSFIHNEVIERFRIIVHKKKKVIRKTFISLKFQYFTINKNYLL